MERLELETRCCAPASDEQVESCKNGQEASYENFTRTHRAKTGGRWDSKAFKTSSSLSFELLDDFHLRRKISATNSKLCGYEYGEDGAAVLTSPNNLFSLTPATSIPFDFELSEKPWQYSSEAFDEFLGEEGSRKSCRSSSPSSGSSKALKKLSRSSSRALLPDSTLVMQRPPLRRFRSHEGRLETLDNDRIPDKFFLLDQGEALPYLAAKLGEGLSPGESHSSFVSEKESFSPYEASSSSLFESLSSNTEAKEQSTDSASSLINLLSLPNKVKLSSRRQLLLDAKTSLLKLFRDETLSVDAEVFGKVSPCTTPKSGSSHPESSRSPDKEPKEHPEDTAAIATQSKRHTASPGCPVPALPLHYVPRAIQGDALTSYMQEINSDEPSFGSVEPQLLPATAAQDVAVERDLTCPPPHNQDIDCSATQPSHSPQSSLQVEKLPCQPQHQFQHQEFQYQQEHQLISPEHQLHSQEHQFRSQDHQFQPQDQQFQPQDQQFQPQEHQLQPQEHRFQPQEHRFQPQEHQFQPQEHNLQYQKHFEGQEQHCQQQGQFQHEEYRFQPGTSRCQLSRPQLQSVHWQFKPNPQQFQPIYQQFLPVRQQVQPVRRQFLPVRQQFPPVRQQFPPVRQQFPPVRQQFPPVRQQFPPVGQQFPPVGQQFPPVGQQFPPVGQQFPSVRQQYPPVRQQYPPVRQQYPPVRQQYPPVRQQYPPVRQQYPPVRQQYPPVRQQHPPVRQQHPPVSQQYPPVRQHFHSIHERFQPIRQQFNSTRRQFQPTPQQLQPSQHHLQPTQSQTLPLQQQQRLQPTLDQLQTQQTEMMPRQSYQLAFPRPEDYNAPLQVESAQQASQSVPFHPYHHSSQGLGPSNLYRRPLEVCSVSAAPTRDIRRAPQYRSLSTQEYMEHTEMFDYHRPYHSRRTMSTQEYVADEDESRARAVAKRSLSTRELAAEHVGVHGTGYARRTMSTQEYSTVEEDNQNPFTTEFARPVQNPVQFQAEDLKQNEFPEECFNNQDLDHNSGKRLYQTRPQEYHNTPNRSKLLTELGPLEKPQERCLQTGGRQFEVHSLYASEILFNKHSNNEVEDVWKNSSIGRSNFFPSEPKTRLASRDSTKDRFEGEFVKSPVSSECQFGAVGSELQRLRLRSLCPHPGAAAEVQNDFPLLQSALKFKSNEPKKEQAFTDSSDDKLSDAGKSASSMYSKAVKARSQVFLTLTAMGNTSPELYSSVPPPRVSTPKLKGSVSGHHSPSSVSQTSSPDAPSNMKKTDSDGYIQPSLVVRENFLLFPNMNESFTKKEIYDTKTECLEMNVPCVSYSAFESEMGTTSFSKWVSSMPQSPFISENNIWSLQSADVRTFAPLQIT